jgi:hypothetical protein
MAQIFVEVLGDMLLLPTTQLNDADALLPSPEELACKVLLKGCRSDTRRESMHDDDDDDDYSSHIHPGRSTETDSGAAEQPSIKLPQVDADISVPPMPSIEESTNVSKRLSDAIKSGLGVDLQEVWLSAIHRMSLKVSTDPSLSGITYFSKHKQKSFEMASPCDCLSSYSEGKAHKTLCGNNDDELKQWIQFNSAHISRIYPSGLRIDSSNYDPYLGWGVGAQLVALNTQTPCLESILNQGFFRRNGDSGYILKPEYLLNPSKQPRPRMKLRVNIISGQNLPRSNDLATTVNPHVTVSIHGVSEAHKNSVTEKHTASVVGNGFNPIWNEVFEFNVDDIELTQIAFRVFHSILGDRRKSSSQKHNLELSAGTDDLIAIAAYPIIDLRPGFRQVQLCDLKGERQANFAFVSLFVHIALTEAH